MTEAAGRYRWALLAAVFGLYLGFGVVASSLAPLVGTISEDLGLSRSQMGVVLGAWQFVYLASSVPAGRLLDRLGLRWGLLLGIGLVAASGFLRAAAVGWGSLLLAVGVFGLGGPLISIGMPTLVSAWFSGDARGPATGAAAGGPVVGSVITLLSANGLLMPLYGDRWRLVVATYAVIAALAGVVWLVVTARVPAAVEAPWRPAAGRAVGSRQLLREPVMRIVLIMATGTFFVNHALGNWLPEMLRDGGLSASAASAWAAIPSLVGLAGGIAVPRLAVPRLRRAVLAACYLVLGAGVVSLVGDWSSFTVVGLLAIGAMRSAALPIAMLFLMDSPRVGPANMAGASALYFTAGEIGGVTGPLTVGVLADRSGGFATAQWSLAGVTLVLASLALSRSLRAEGSR
ncbi:MAG: MFS transporter [Actinomycetia bacterium]|nr:MFS transporter [Actinomycetes bacterium]